MKIKILFFILLLFNMGYSFSYNEQEKKGFTNFFQNMVDVKGLRKYNTLSNKHKMQKIILNKFEKKYFKEIYYSNIDNNIVYFKILKNDKKLGIFNKDSINKFFKFLIKKDKYSKYFKFIALAPKIVENYKELESLKKIKKGNLNEMLETTINKFKEVLVKKNIKSIINIYKYKNKYYTFIISPKTLINLNFYSNSETFYPDKDAVKDFLNNKIKVINNLDKAFIFAKTTEVTNNSFDRKIYITKLIFEKRCIEKNKSISKQLKEIYIKYPDEKYKKFIDIIKFDNNKNYYIYFTKVN